LQRKYAEESCKTPIRNLAHSPNFSNTLYLDSAQKQSKLERNPCRNISEEVDLSIKENNPKNNFKPAIRP